MRAPAGATSSPQALRRRTRELPIAIALAMVFWCAPIVAIFTGLSMAGDCDTQGWTSCSAAQEFGNGFAALILLFLLVVSLPLTVLFSAGWSFLAMIRFIRRHLQTAAAPPASAVADDHRMHEQTPRGSSARRLAAICCAAIFLGSTCVSSVVLWDQHESLTRGEFRARLPTSGSETEFRSALQQLVRERPGHTKIHYSANDSFPIDSDEFPLARRYISVSVQSGSWVQGALDPFCNDSFGASIYFDEMGNHLGTSFYDSNECL